MTMKPTRCSWAGDDPIYIDYHDGEWGVPLYDDQLLFESLVLDGAQAGLSWITILKRRDEYRRCFDHFDASKMARYNAKKIETLLNDPGIIRNRLKVESAVKNAKAFLALQESGPGFSNYLWQFVEGKPIQNKWKTHQQLPALTPISEKMSKDLKKRGFTFVGPTICYAFMQAVGMVNDHVVSCFRHKAVKKR